LIDVVKRLNHRFFATTTSILTGAGFSMVDDLLVSVPADDETSEPQLMRYMFRSIDCTGAAIYQIDDRSPLSIFEKWFFALSRRWPTRAQIVEFETEFASGHCMNTTRGQNIFEAPNTISRVVVDQISISQLLALHEQRLREYRHSNPRDLPIAVNSTSDLVAKEERLRAAKRAFRRSVGGLTDNELRLILRNRYDDLRDPLVREIAALTAKLMAKSNDCA
jgi:hypothetical protein